MVWYGMAPETKDVSCLPNFGQIANSTDCLHKPPSIAHQLLILYLM